MRTDAKIGFAIVGVLVAVLMGFLLVNSRHGSQARNTKPGADANTVKLAPQSPEVAPVVVPPLSNPDPVQTAKLPDAVPPAGPLVPSNELPKPSVADNNALNNALPPLDPFKPDALPLPHKADRGAGLAQKTEKGTRAPGKRHPQGSDEPPVATAGQRHYTVRAGQTLTSIASDIYGDPMAYKQILSANPGLNPSKLRVGKKILIPDAATVRPHPSVVVPASDVIYPDDSGETMITAGQTYRVQSGDSLYKLAKRFFGSGRRADALYELNRDVIGTSPSHLKRGMVLRLPTAAGALSDASR